ncbi:MAG: glycosyltransferase [Flavobacteriales bacterium]|nr:glycosyltransferase [Flavobacteriales bacterium]
MQPHVSVIITCFNLGAYLHEALGSIGLDVHVPVEVIVVDDGSTDPATIQILDSMDPQRFTLLRQRNMGLAAARNNGIKAAQGKYIIPLDADNRLRPAMISQVVSVLAARPEVDIVFGDAQYFGEREGRFRMGPADLSAMLERNRIDACAGFRKGLWERVGGYDEQMPVMGYEDWEFWLRSLISHADFHYTDEVLFDYRVREGSMLSNTIKHREVIVEYIFNKPEFRHLRELRRAYVSMLERERNPRTQTGRELMNLLVERIKERILPTQSKVAHRPKP